MMGYYIIGAKSPQERPFTNRGVQSGFPLCQGSGGVPPNSKLPHDWGIQGVEILKTYFYNLTNYPGAAIIWLTAVFVMVRAPASAQ